MLLECNNIVYVENPRTPNLKATTKMPHSNLSNLKNKDVKNTAFLLLYYMTQILRTKFLVGTVACTQIKNEKQKYFLHIKKMFLF